MKVKITDRILSVNPYLTTKWDSIQSLHQDNGQLVVCLQNGQQIKLPELDEAVLDQIFSKYETIFDTPLPDDLTLQPKEAIRSPYIPTEEPGGIVAPPIHFGMPGMGGIGGAAFQHDSSQMHSPDLPAEMLEKIAAVTKVIAADDIQQMPKAEPHCNCPHCQILRAIHSDEIAEPVLAIQEEEPVADEELTFRSWNIEEATSNLYTVTNPLDATEQYQVFLGEPVGCTCGQADCQHIKSVLLS